MKIYLILLTVSVICGLVSLMDAKVYIRKHYVRVKSASATEKVSAYIKLAILTAIIFPYIIACIMDIFARESYLQGVDNGVSEEYWMPREDA